MNERLETVISYVAGRRLRVNLFQVSRGRKYPALRHRPKKNPHDRTRPASSPE